MKTPEPEFDDSPERYPAFQAVVPVPTEQNEDRRQLKRHISVFLLAKIVANGRQSLGRVLNLSELGAKLDTRLKLTPGQSLFLEIRSDLKVGGTVRWVRDKMVGIEFNNPINIAGFLSRQKDHSSRVKARPPRYDCEVAASVSVKANRSVAEARDVSLLGARLAGLTDFRVNDEVLVTIFGLQPRLAKVAWVNQDEVGVTFLKPLNFRDLDAWLETNALQPQAK
jgi:hypothetical protein